MTDENDVQAAVENAFAWVHRVYRESRALLTEATELLDRAGFQCWDKSGRPYVAQSGDTTDLLVSYYSTPEQIDAPAGMDIFVGVSLYPDSRYRRGNGPCLLAGTAKRNRAEVKYGANALNFAARAPGTGGCLFTVRSPPGDPLVVCEPTETGKVQFAGIGTVRSIALPLTDIRTSDDIGEIVGAVVEMRKDNDLPVRALLARR